jgi:hypothetical protein
LEILKGIYYISHSCKQSKKAKYTFVVPTIILRRDLDVHKRHFKVGNDFNAFQIMVMAIDNVNPVIFNPLMCI